MYEFNINLSEEDFIIYNEYHLRNSINGNKQLLSFKIILPLICILIVSTMYIATLDIQLALIEIIPLSIISVVWVVFSKKMLIVSLKKGIKKLKKDGKLPFINESIIKFTDEFIYETTPLSECKLKYSSIEKIAIADSAFYIYISSVQALIIPYSVFSHENGKQEFLDFLISKTNKMFD